MTSVNTTSSRAPGGQDFSYIPHDNPDTWPKELGKTRSNLNNDSRRGRIENPRVNVEDSNYRIQEIIQRILSIEIALGAKGHPITIGDILADPEVRSRFLRKLRKKISKKIKNLAKKVRTQFHAVLNNPKVAEAIEIQQRHASFKVICYALKMLNALAKIPLIPYSEEVKSIHSLVKFARKAGASADLFDRMTTIDNVNEFIYKSLKASYTSLSILTDTVEVVNNNAITQGAYALAGWGSDLQPFPELVVNCCNGISPILTIVQLGVKASGLRKSITKYYSDDINTASTLRYKKWKVIKASAEFAGESLKFGFKGLLFIGFAAYCPTVAAAGAAIIPFVTVGVAFTSASIGWVQTYQKKRTNSVPRVYGEQDPYGISLPPLPETQSSPKQFNERLVL